MSNYNKFLVSFSLMLLVLSASLGSLTNNYIRETNRIFVDEIKVKALITSLSEVLDFINKYYYEMNLDGALGIILTEVQLLNSFNNQLGDELIEEIEMLSRKFHDVSRKVIELLPKNYKNELFTHFLLNPDLWKINSKFVDDQLIDLGTYKSWTIQDILKNKTADYDGVSSDECLTEILQEIPSNLQKHSCYISPRCEMLMFGNRIDTEYVLTHRLLYLRILRMVNCLTDEEASTELIKEYCSLMLKEARTNEFLGFPQYDIFLEQVVLCGMEGFTEFLQTNWRRNIIEWQTIEGCYKPDQSDFNIKNAENKIEERSARIIAFGCTNHATGLGAAALALNLRYALSQLVE